jgi:CheY-like chemotaxis protein
MERAVSRKRILVVDDDPQLAESMQLFLETCGHSVQVANTGERALGLAAALRPDVVILDIQMKGLDGLEVCRKIRASDWGTRMHLLAVTAWADPHAGSRCFAAGFDRYFAKPVDPELIVGAIDHPDVRRPSAANVPYA